MSQYNARLFHKDIFESLVAAEPGDSEVVCLNGASKFSCQAVYDVQSPSAKTFDSPQFATLLNQALTYTALTAGVGGNAISIELINPGVDGALSIQVTGNAIAVTLAYATGAITTTRTQLKNAINGDVDASALVLVTGASATLVTALSPTNLAGGSDGEIDVAESTVTIPSHGFVAGLQVQLSSTGTLPGPINTLTDYFIIVVDASTVQFALTLEDALAGIPIELVDTGSDGAVATVTAEALAGASVTFKKSDDRINWVDIQAATAISADGSVMLTQENVSYLYFKATKALTAGVVDLKGLTLVIGDAV